MSLSREQIWERIQAELAASLGLEPPVPGLTPASRLRGDLGLGSLKTVDLVIKLEDAFGVAIADDELATLVTAADLVELVARKTAVSSSER